MSTGINENYWTCKGAGYQKKTAQLPSVPVGATRQQEPGNQRSTDKWLSNPSSHLQFTSLKLSAFNNMHTELKAEQRDHVSITVQGSSQIKEISQSAAWLWHLRYIAKHALNSLSLHTATQTCSFPHAQTLNIMKKINPDRHEPKLWKSSNKCSVNNEFIKKSCFQLCLHSVDIKYVIYFCNVCTLPHGHFTLASSYINAVAFGTEK